MTEQGSILVSPEVEGRFIGCLLGNDDLFHEITRIPLACFVTKDRIRLVEALKIYEKTYHRRPSSPEAFQSFLQKQFPGNYLEIAAAYIDDTFEEVPAGEYEVLMDTLKDLTDKRVAFEVDGLIRSGLADRTGQEVLAEVTQKLIEYQIKATDGIIDRGWYWEGIDDRLAVYDWRKKNPGKLLGVPFGIKRLDDLCGGIQRKFLVLVYGDTSIGKSKFLINVSHNAASAGFGVMYVSLEMARDNVAMCLDSRSALLNYTGIERGTLVAIQEEKFRKVMEEQKQKRIPLWIVDLPELATVNHLIAELHNYKALVGKYPDLIALDYANLMRPTKSTYGASESSDYDRLFVELHFEIARKFNIGILTAVQESRTKGEGVKGIGKSHYVATHCHGVIHLYQNQTDPIVNILRYDVDKNRFGPKLKDGTMCCVYALNYMGDEKISALDMYASTLSFATSEVTSTATLAAGENPNVGNW